MSYSKEDAIRIVVECAEKYRNELDQRSLLFLCLDKHRKLYPYEFYFNGYNFLHLTGLRVHKTLTVDDEIGSSVLSAESFYQKCLSHRLSQTDFEFAEDGTTPLKLDVLPALLTKNLAASMIGDYNYNKPRLYTEKLAGGVKACVGFTIDEITGHLVPNTVLKEDIRNNVQSWVRVVAVFRKPISATKYEEITYLAKNIEWKDQTMPEPFRYLKGLLMP